MYFDFLCARHDAFSHTGQGKQFNPYDMSHKASGARTREIPVKKADAVDQLVEKVDTRACIWGLDPNKKKVPTLVIEKNTWQQPKNARRQIASHCKYGLIFVMFV